MPIVVSYEDAQLLGAMAHQAGRGMRGREDQRNMLSMIQQRRAQEHQTGMAREQMAHREQMAQFSQGAQDQRYMMGVESRERLKEMDLAGEMGELEFRVEHAQELEGLKQEGRYGLEGMRQGGRSALEQQKQTGRIDVEQIRQVGRGALLEMKQLGLVTIEELRQAGRLDALTAEEQARTARQERGFQHAGDLEQGRQQNRMDLEDRRQEGRLEIKSMEGGIGTSGVPTKQQADAEAARFYQLLPVRQGGSAAMAGERFGDVMDQAANISMMPTPILQKLVEQGNPNERFRAYMEAILADRLGQTTGMGGGPGLVSSPGLVDTGLGGLSDEDLFNRANSLR